MPSTTMGMSTSGPRVTLNPKTSDPPSSKVVSNTAHGASMKIPVGGPVMKTEEYGKSGKYQTKPGLEFGIKGPRPKVL